MRISAPSFFTPSKPIWMGSVQTAPKILNAKNAQHKHMHAQHALKYMKYEIQNNDIRPNYLKENLYFLVPKSSTHTGMDCVKKLGDEYFMLGPL